MKKDDNKTKDGGFLQSDSWMKFQKSVGKEVVLLKEKNQFLANMLLHKLPIVGSYFFIPRGPIMLDRNFVEKCSEKILQKAKEAGVGWIRIEPQTQEELRNFQEEFSRRGFKVVKARKNHQPTQTLMLDLTKSEEDLLSEMKSKTRYNIRLAKKKGVKIEQSRNKKDVENFISLSKETAKRDGIAIHPDRYYRKMIAEISEDTLALYIARFEEEVIAVASVSFFGGVATYLHGASSNRNRNVMAPYLLQWQAILDAKKKKCLKYDFGGTRITDSEQKNSWAGITRFKQGFCPKNREIKFPGCWDVVIEPKKYYTYSILQKIKDLKTWFGKWL